MVNRLRPINNRIRVLHPITRLIVGGAQENTMYTAELLDKARYDVEILSGPQTGSEGSLIEEIRSRGIQLTVFPDLLRQVSLRHDFLCLIKLIQFMRRGKYSIVHTHSSKAGILGRLAAKIAGIPNRVHTVHGWSFHDHMHPLIKKIYILLERWMAKISDILITVAEEDIQKGLENGIGHPEQYRLVRSAIPLDEYTPEKIDRETIREELKIPLDALVVGNVGRFSSQKNPLDWVQVAGIVNRVLPECYFLLVGDGPLRREVVSQIEKEGIGNRTILTGLRRDVPKLMAAMDVFMITSLWEGLPRVIPEAMVMGLPVIANAVDGSSEIVKQGQTGYLCPPGAVDEMAKLLIEILYNPFLRKQMGDLGRNIARREFDLNLMVEQIDIIYQELLSQ